MKNENDSRLPGQDDKLARIISISPDKSFSAMGAA
jgi:hypothetical protein